MKLNPRARVKEDKIEQAAQKLFLKNGFTGTSMDAITKEAGVSKQTVYVYFSSKEDLLFAVFRKLIEKVTTEPFAVSEYDLSIQSREDLRQSLQILAESIVSSLMQPSYLAMARVVLAELSRFPQLGTLFKDAVPKRVLKTIVSILNRARQEEVIMIKKEQTEALARMFIGPILTYILLDGLLVADNEIRQPDARQLDDVVRNFMKTLE